MNRAEIEKRIVAVEYVKRGTKTLVFITLDNGWVQSGESNCLDVEDYREHIGSTVAYDHAVDQLWPLFGFMEKEDEFRLARPEGEPPFADI